jgi:hypothetical protein
MISFTLDKPIINKSITYLVVFNFLNLIYNESQNILHI